MNTETMRMLRAHLSPQELAAVRNASAEVTSLELHWRHQLERQWSKATERLLWWIEQTGELPDEMFFDFRDFLTSHRMNVQRQATDEALAGTEKVEDHQTRLAGVKMPRGLGKLMELWDRWRKGRLPRRQRILGDRVKAAYLKKIKSVWERHSHAYREGTSADREAVRQAIRRASYATYARAQMIVDTETTRYWNQGRRYVYDTSPDVTHYLFVAIRDAATTRWCRTRNGVVYTKGTRWLEIETPPCHWNCRSEILPLSAHNPRHAALIANLGLRRERRRPFPLPPCWNREAA